MRNGVTLDQAATVLARAQSAFLCPPGDLDAPNPQQPGCLRR